MEQNKEEAGKGECCSSESKKCCCCGKAVKVLILLLIGGVIGYFIGHCGGMNRWCKYHGAATPPCPMTAPAATTPSK